MKEKIILDTLTQDGVSIIRQQYTTINDVEYAIGKPWRIAYANSIGGRTQVQSEVTEPYKSAIMAMWGESATVTENSENTTS